ncbi:Inner membrane protein YedI [Escherichia coli]|nr:Inner membrane protein YedI [Escherichia coli]
MLLAGSSLLTLLDDIATLLDDISVMGKLAAKKTAGVLGDDLSLNAHKFQACGPTGNFPWSGAWRKVR